MRRPIRCKPKPPEMTTHHKTGKLMRTVRPFDNPVQFDPDAVVDFYRSDVHLTGYARFVRRFYAVRSANERKWLAGE